MRGLLDHTWRNLWRLSWPLVATMFLQFSVGLTDTYVAGGYGPEAQGAVGFGGQLLFFFNVLASALGVGLVALVARAQGAGDLEVVRHASRQGLLLALLLTLPTSALGWLASPSAGRLGFLPAAVARHAETLLPAYALSLVPQGILAVTAAVFRARGHTGRVLLCWGVTAGLNLWWVFALSRGWHGLPALGPQGIGIATAASSTAGSLVSLWLLLAETRGRDWVDGWRLDRDLIARLWSLAWPSGLLQLGWQLAGLALFGILGSLPSGAVAGTAALTNGLRIEAALYLPAFALNMVAAVLVGQSLGGGRPEAAMRVGWRIAGAATAVLTAVALPVFAFSRELAGLLSPDAAVREATHLYLRFNMVSQPFMALSLCLGGGLQGAGDTRGTMKVVLWFLWGVRIPSALVLSRFFGSTGVWAAMVASMVLQGLAMAARFRAGVWRTPKRVR